MEVLQPITNLDDRNRPYANVLASQQPGKDDVQRIDAAPLYLRVPAVMIDGMVVIGPAVLLNGAGSGELFSIIGSVFTIVSLLTLPATFLPGALLLALLEGLTGKTAGKLLMGIRVTGVEDGESIGLIRAIGRRALMVMESFVFFIPSIILIPSNRNFDGHLGDRLTGAIVARDCDIAQAFPE